MRLALLIAFVLSVSAPGFAQEAQSSDSASKGQVSVLFMQLRAVGKIDPSKIRLLENVVIGELHKNKKFRVLSRRDVENLLDADGFKQALDCDAESCLVSVAGALGTKLMISGELGYIDEGAAVLSLQILTTADSTVRSQVTETVEGEGRELIPQVQRAVLKLISGYDPSYPLTASLHPDSPMSAATSGSELQSDTIWTSWWLWTGVGVLAIGAGAYVLLSGESANGDGNQSSDGTVIFDLEVGQ